MEPLQTFRYHSLKVETFYAGNNKLPVKVYIDNKLVHEDIFTPGSAIAIDSTNAMVDLLGFLTLQKGDTDAQYFLTRNAPKLDRWANRNIECSLIQMLLLDWEQKDNEEYRKENMLTYDDCLEIEKYITNH